MATNAKSSKEHQLDWEYSRRPLYRSIIRANLGSLGLPVNAIVRPATREEDYFEATDQVIEFSDGTKQRVACRERDESAMGRFGEHISIRAINGTKETEIHKKRYAGDYLFGWGNEHCLFYYFLDLARAYSKGLDEQGTFQRNWDGETGFIWVPVEFFRDNGCILVERQDIYINGNKWTDEAGVVHNIDRWR